jgi:hypothetical protein
MLLRTADRALYAAKAANEARPGYIGTFEERRTGTSV